RRATAANQRGEDQRERKGSSHRLARQSIPRQRARHERACQGRAPMSPSMRRPPRGQLSIPQTVLLMVLGQGLLQGLVLAGAALRAGARGVSFQDAARELTSEPFGPGLAQLVALGAVTLLGVRLAYGERGLRDALRIAPVPTSVALLAMVAGFCFQFPMVELMTWLSEWLPGVARDPETLERIERMIRIDS